MTTSTVRTMARSVVRAAVTFAVILTAVVFVFGPNAWLVAVVVTALAGTARWALVRRHRARVRRTARRAERLARALLH